MPKESTIQHYTSSTTGSAPLAVNLASGELAINTADEKVFYKNHNGVVLSLSQTKDLSGAFAASSRAVSSFNGLTGAVTLTGDGGSSFVLGNNVTTNRIATTSVTGVASFNGTRFTVSAAGAVDLAAAFQVTGQTVVSGGASQLVSTSGNTVTIDNRIATASLTGVASFSSTFFTVSATGSVQLAAAYQATGSGIATVPLATTSLTGTASFNPNRFQVSATGNVDLLAAYQATGDTVITVAGSGIAISTSGKTDTLYNIGVTSFNGATGAVTFTVPLATTSLTGTASFNPNRFQVSATGNVDLVAAFQVTGQTVVSGGASQLVSTSGNTVTIDNRVATSSVTGVASFNATRFTVSAAGAVDLAAAYQVTGQTIVAGNNISTTTSGNTVTINVTAAGANTYVQFNSNGSLSADNGLQFDSSTETLRIGSAVRHLEIIPGIDNLVQAFGASNLRLVQAAGNPITIGDFDGNYGGNNTYIQVDDINSNIYMNAASMSLDSAVSIGFGLSASSLYVSTGATFNSSLDVNGNATLGNAATDTTTIYGTKIVNEGVYANGSLRTANISFANGQVQTLTGVGTGATGATAIYFTNAPSSGAASVTMIITNGGLMSGTGMTAWGGNIKWPAGIKPVLTSSGVDVVSFVTPDAGTTIYGFVGGLNFL